MKKTDTLNELATSYCIDTVITMPIINVAALLFLFFGNFRYMSGRGGVIASLVINLLATALLIGASNIRPLREHSRFRPFMIAVCFIDGAALATLWSLFALPLLLLPLLIASYDQENRFMATVGKISLLTFAAVPLISLIFSIGSFGSQAKASASPWPFIVTEAAIGAVLCVGIITAISFHIKKSNNIRNLANTVARDDQLGIYNKTQFQISMKNILAESEDRQYTLLVTNIVKFRLFNDLFGHSAGDRLLANVVETLNQYIGREGIIGRLSDDHIVCMMSSHRVDYEKIKSLLFHNKDFVKNSDDTVDVICGLYEITNKRISSDIMFDCALTAVRSKRAHREGIAVYRESMLQEEYINKEFFKELTIALEQNQFVPYFQVQHSSDGAVVGAEVLCRWQHPDRGILKPNAFVPLCEENGLISKLDRDIWIKACETLAYWDKNGIAGCPLSVNVSPIDIYEMDFYKTITEIVDNFGIAHHRLHLEITETAISKDPLKFFETVQKLRSSGFVIMIDNFGSGYSSLSMLSDIEVDFIKLDMSFLRRLDTGKNTEKVLAGIVALANSLGIKVIVEGVETERQIRTLNMLGYQYYQGYYFSKPIDLEEFEQKFLA